MQNFYRSPATQYSSTCYAPSNIKLFLNGFLLACQISLHSFWVSSLYVGVLPFLHPKCGKFWDVFMASRFGVAQYFRTGTKRKKTQNPWSFLAENTNIYLFVCFKPRLLVLTEAPGTRYLMEQESQIISISISAWFCASCSDDAGDEISRIGYWLELYGQQCHSLMVDITRRKSLEDTAFQAICEYYSPPMPFESHKAMNFNSGRLGGKRKKRHQFTSNFSFHMKNGE